jgi:hypothetical protein
MKSFSQFNQDIDVLDYYNNKKMGFSLILELMMVLKVLIHFY